ncbi:alanine--tRNA ligase [Desertibaculum subflavum]|uniref:alanine--tRNA ligase n=1 Tax=Desertibaculum subflavum TaxID=2268458 RepID=UPI000E664A01
MASGNEIRKAFLDYFARHQHTIVPSSPLVPANDPTLLFTNAGMVQFKNVFTGMEKRPYTQATTSQKCVRAGGKHNDLDNVGYTARHHTFFEMLGNFSFGDYFKERAIELAWNLVHKEFGLSKDRLWVTVYHEDEEALALWKQIAGLPEDRIVKIATSDNFWAMGDTGPCGPCSEIFFDHGPKIAGGPPGSPDADGDRYIEIWNLVFMQYEQRGPGDRVPLPRPSIDTGMGLERIAAVLQGRHDNYDTDLLRKLIEASAQATGVDPDGPQAVSHRVIADHLRASSFLIADGVLPSNEGRGYVLRRIMRRGMRHAHMLGAREPLMHRLVPALTEMMGPTYQELVRAEPLIRQTLELEETRFKETLERGLKLLDEEMGRIGTDAPLPGEVAFKLYDTFGFPIDLTQDVLRGRGRTVDTAGFEAAMQRQKAEARKAWAGSGEQATEAVWFEIREEAGATEFLGYETDTAEGRVVAIVKGGQRVDEAKAGEDALIVLGQTPFYAESGGQTGDAGTMSAPGVKVTVSDAQKKAGELHVHVSHIDQGTVRVGDALALAIDPARRDCIRANHSATHLLHAALRRRLGGHVTQKGSLVGADGFRFDFSHPTPLSDADLRTVVDEVNAQVRINTPVETRLMTPEKAIEAGAMALFGEKYGDEVRVLAMGRDLTDDGGAKPYSVELCGGTHVRRTGDIGAFTVLGQSAVAAGVRRIEAATGAGALQHFAREHEVLQQITRSFNAPAEEVPGRIAALLDERRKLEREVSELRVKLATGGGGGGAAPAAREVNGVRFATRKLDGVPAKDLRGLADAVKGEIGSGVVAIVSVSEGKAALVVAVSDDLTGKVSAVDLVRAGSAALGGKGGGGRPDFAQAGGPDGDKAEEALAAIEQAIGQRAAA